MKIVLPSAEIITEENPLKRIEIAEDVRMDIAGASGNILRVTMSDPTY